MPSQHERQKSAAQGAAIAAAGGVTAGTGLAAGGVPGGKSDFSAIMDLKKPEKKGVKGAVKAVKDNRHVARVAPGGILGFRSSAHRGGLYGFGLQRLEDKTKPAKTAHEAFFQGRNAGKIKPEKQILRHMSRGKKAAGAALIGGAGAMGYGARQARDSVNKSERSDKYNGALLGGGAATAGVSHGASSLLGSQKKKWEGRAIVHTDAAGTLVPKIAGRKGNSMYPAISDGEIKRNPQLLEGTKKKTARKAGALRGAAVQERHFAEVYGSTQKVVRRGRTPGLIAAAAGAGGLYATHKKPVKKSATMSAFGVDHV